MKVLLIGGAGFIGKNIQYIYKGDILVVYDLSSGTKNLETNNLSIVQDYSITLDSIKKWRENKNIIIVFLAGETRVSEAMSRPLDFVKANISKPSIFLNEVLKEGDRVILASTCGAMFDGTLNISQNTIPKPLNFYGYSKLAQEQVLTGICKLHKCDLIITRFTNVFGILSEHKKSAIHAFIKASFKGRTVKINGAGEQTRDFIFAQDVAHGIIKLFDKENKSETGVEIFARGQSHSVNEIYKFINSITPLQKKHIASTELLSTEPDHVIVEKNAISQFFSNSVSFFDALEQTYKYYSENN